MTRKPEWVKKWKITISPTQRMIRIKVGQDVKSETIKTLKRLSKSVYKEWVYERKETKTIRAHNPPKKKPVSFKMNGSKTVLSKRLCSTPSSYSIYKALLNGRKLFRITDTDTNKSRYSLGLSNTQMEKRYSGSDRFDIQKVNRLTAFYKLGKNYE